MLCYTPREIGNLVDLIYYYKFCKWMFQIIYKNMQYILNWKYYTRLQLVHFAASLHMF